MKIVQVQRENNNFHLERTQMKAEVYRSHRQLNNSEMFMQLTVNLYPLYPLSEKEAVNEGTLFRRNLKKCGGVPQVCGALDETIQTL